MKESRLGVFEFLSDIACQAEIWVLVDCTWYQAGDVRCGAEDLRKGIGKRWGRLD